MFKKKNTKSGLQVYLTPFERSDETLNYSKFALQRKRLSKVMQIVYFSHVFLNK